MNNETRFTRPDLFTGETMGRQVDYFDNTCTSDSIGNGGYTGSPSISTDVYTGGGPGSYPSGYTVTPIYTTGSGGRSTGYGGGSVTPSTSNTEYTVGGYGSSSTSDRYSPSPGQIGYNGAPATGKDSPESSLPTIAPVTATTVTNNNNATKGSMNRLYITKIMAD